MVLSRGSRPSSNVGNPLCVQSGTPIYPPLTGVSIENSRLHTKLTTAVGSFSAEPPTRSVICLYVRYGWVEGNDVRSIRMDHAEGRGCEAAQRSGSLECPVPSFGLGPTDTENIKEV